MISPAGNFKIYLASSPVDYRKGMDGLAAIILAEYELDPFSGAIFIFRSKRADRLKTIVWDGTGLVLVHKRLEGKGFVWPRSNDGIMTLSKAQFEILFEGLDWRRIASRKTGHPLHQVRLERQELRAKRGNGYNVEKTVVFA